MGRGRAERQHGTFPLPDHGDADDDDDNDEGDRDDDDDNDDDDDDDDDADDDVEMCFIGNIKSDAPAARGRTVREAAG